MPRLPTEKIEKKRIIAVCKTETPCSLFSSMKFINIGCYELYDKSVERELWREREREGQEGKEGGARGKRERERERERKEKRGGEMRLCFCWLCTMYTVNCIYRAKDTRAPECIATQKDVGCTERAHIIGTRRETKT